MNYIPLILILLIFFNNIVRHRRIIRRQRLTVPQSRQEEISLLFLLFIIFMYLVVPLKSIVLLLAWNQGFVDELTFCILFVSHHYLWATKITLIIYLDRVIDRTTMQARRRFKAPQILMVIMTSILATCTISLYFTSNDRFKTTLIKGLTDMEKRSNFNIHPWEGKSIGDCYPHLQSILS